MNKRSIPMAIAGCVLALAGIAGYFSPAPTEAVPPRILMDNQGGRVVFTHQAHSTPGGAYGDISCADCHHELKIAPKKGNEPADPAAVMNCGACHGTADDPGFIASHQERYQAKGGDASCISCHHTRITGFSAKWNHEDHWDYAGDDCQTCHHADGKTSGSGRLLTDIKPQRCANCHTAKPNPMTATTRKDAGHAKCISCHEDLFEAKVKGCATCHGQADFASELANGTLDKKFTSCATCHAPIQGRMDAFHANCIGCHDKVKKGPGKAAADCTKCHTP